MKLRRFNINREALLVLCAAVTGALASLIPWPNIFANLSGNEMWDRGIYIQQIISGNTPITYIEYDSWIRFFTHEYLWALLLDFVSKSSYLHYETFFQIISALSLSAFSAVLVKKTNILALPLLINPLVIDLIYSQLRLALALSILMCLTIFHVRRWYVIGVCVAAAIMIHTAAVIFAAAHFVALMTAPNGRPHRWRAHIRVTIIILFGFLVGISVGPLREEILSAIGDRRAVYSEKGSSILYNSFWIVLFFALILDFRRTLRNYNSRYALAILGIIFIGTFTGVYTQRFISAAFPHLISGILTVFGRDNFLIFFPYFVYFSFQWFYYITNLIS